MPKLFLEFFSSALFILLLHAAFIDTKSHENCPANSMARYRMEIRGTWTESFLNTQMMPTGFPIRWLWSTGIGISSDAREDHHHRESVKTKLYNFVKKGGLPNTISSLSKTGSGILDIFLLPPLTSTGGESSTVFFIDSNHSRVSFMNRMNHKPHWTLAVDFIDLCHHGRFRDVYELDLFPSDYKPRSTSTSPKPSAPENNRNHETTKKENANKDSPRSQNGHTLVSPRYFGGQHERKSNGNTGHKNRNNYDTPSSTKTATTPSYLSSNEIDHGPSYKGYKPYGRDGYVNQQSIVVPRNILVTSKTSTEKPQVTTGRSPLVLQDNIPERKSDMPRNTLLKTGPLTREARAAGYRRNHQNRSSQYANYHVDMGYDVFRDNPLYSSQNENGFPEVLPRLATVRFVRIAIYHLSQLPPSGMIRKGKSEATVPLPISIDKPMFKSMPPYFPYRGIVSHPRVGKGNSPSRSNTNRGYGYWPSSSVITQSLALHPHDLHPLYDHAWPLHYQYMYPYVV